MPSPERDWAESDYVRIYQQIREDTKFATVLYDDRAFAAYVRLLMDADLAYPVKPSLPAWLTKYARDRLEKAGILVVKGQSYTLSGLRKERESRYGSGKGRRRYPSDMPGDDGSGDSGAGAESESESEQSGVDSDLSRSDDGV